MNVNPVVLNRAALEEKVITLRLVPKMATSIRMPEPVNSVVLGDPENFLAEHSEHEPEMVTVKPVNSEAAQTNLLITTTRGHQVNLLLVSNGENRGVEQPVDVFLKFGRPSATSFLVEEDAQPSSFIAETRKITAELKGPEMLSFSGTAGESGNLIRTASLEGLNQWGKRARRHWTNCWSVRNMLRYPSCMGKNPVKSKRASA